MKRKLFGLSLLVSLFALVFTGCAGSSSNDPEKLNDAIVGFTSCVQGARWQEALDYVSEGEARDISPDGYDFKEEYKVAARRLPISTLKKADLSVDGDGRLVGIKAVMDEANERYKVSENQAKVGTDLKQKEEERIKRRLEEGRKVLEEEEAAAQQEETVEVISNKLTEEEKRKYGSTGELRSAEEFSDENTEQAEEELHGDYETDY